jgi:hypothetical protein
MTIYEQISKTKDINSLEEIRKNVNEACDKRAEFINMCNRANELSERSFGYIKEAFESLAPELFETKKGKKIMKKYAETISENKNLSSLHTIYENIRKMHNGSDIDFFVNEISSKNWEINKNTVTEDVNKVGKVLAEAYIMVGNKSEELLPSTNKKLDNALEFIAENKKTNKNIAEYSDAVKVIREYIESKEGEETNNSYGDIDATAENLINGFNEKYSNELSENEKNMLKELSESDNKESVFNKYKASCQEKLDEEIKKFINDGDSESANKMKKIQEQVSKKVFSEDTVGTDICNLMEMMDIFNK